MTTTGQCAWWATWLLTDPSSSRPNPPEPREPTTSMSASRLASMRTSDGKPLTASTVTVSGAPSGEPGQRLVDFPAGRRARLIDQALVRRVGDRAAREAGDDRVHDDHGQRRVPDARFFHGPFEGERGMIGAVYPDDNPGHCHSPSAFPAPAAHPTNGTGGIDPTKGPSEMPARDVGPYPPHAPRG